MMFLLSLQPTNHILSKAEKILENCQYILRNAKGGLLPYAVGDDEEEDSIAVEEYDALIAQHMQAVRGLLQSPSFATLASHSRRISFVQQTCPLSYTSGVASWPHLHR